MSALSDEMKIVKSTHVVPMNENFPTAHVAFSSKIFRFPMDSQHTHTDTHVQRALKAESESFSGKIKNKIKSQISKFVNFKQQKVVCNNQFNQVI